MRGERKYVLENNDTYKSIRPTYSARLAFVAEAKNYKSSVTIRRADPEAQPQNAKSIIMLLALALKTNTEIEIAAEGEDEVEAVDKLVALVESGLGE